jgi:hypothetical protein
LWWIFFKFVWNVTLKIKHSPKIDKDKENLAYWGYVVSWLWQFRSVIWKWWILVSLVFDYRLWWSIPFLLKSIFFLNQTKIFNLPLAYAKKTFYSIEDANTYIGFSGGKRSTNRVTGFFKRKNMCTFTSFIFFWEFHCSNYSSFSTLGKSQKIWNVDLTMIYIHNIQKGAKFLGAKGVKNVVAALEFKIRKLFGNYFYFFRVTKV